MVAVGAAVAAAAAVEEGARGPGAAATLRSRRNRENILRTRWSCACSSCGSRLRRSINSRSRRTSATCSTAPHTMARRPATHTQSARWPRPGYLAEYEAVAQVVGEREVAREAVGEGLIEVEHLEQPVALDGV